MNDSQERRSRPRHRAKGAKKTMSTDAATAGRGSKQERLRGGAFNQEQRLTTREREILGLFAEGLGTEPIARRLSISRVTVRNHAQRILAKLRVHSRLAAVARAYRDGLVGKPE